MKSLKRRLERLRRRILASRQPIVWLCAGPGTGKSRLLEAFDDWHRLDEPSPAVLQALLAQRADARPRRVLIASRPADPIARWLLKPRIYGQVERLDDADLYVNREDCRNEAERGRESEARSLLPQLLEQELLPDLPPALVAALFAAATMPLPADAIAPNSLAHPLLRDGPGGIRVAGTWVAEALLGLRGHSRALTPPVLDELIRLYAESAEPAQAIIDMLAVGRGDDALAIFRRAGGACFGYRHGYQALQRVLDAFGPEVEFAHDALFFAHEYLLIKSGRTREALLRLDARHPGVSVDFLRSHAAYPPFAILLCIDISLDLDQTPPTEVIASWGRLQSQMPPDDELARGLLFNTMAIGFLQADALVEAGQLALEALATYQRANSPYLAHFMQLHLCDIALRQGQRDEAVARLAQAEQDLAASALTFNSEPAIVASFRSWIAYEEGRFADCPPAAEPLLQALVSGDSWIDLIAGTAGHFVLAAYWTQGLRAALGRLDHLSLALGRRHGWTRHRRLELVRIRLLQVARRHAEAGVRLEEYDLQHWPQTSALLVAEEGLIRLRQHVLAEHVGGEAPRLAAALAANPLLGARKHITLALLQASLALRAGDPARSRRHLRLALREAEAHGLVGVLMEDGEVLERLLPMVIDERAPGNSRLIAFAQRILRLLRALPTAPMHSRRVAAVSRQEHRVLSYLVDGYTNKAIARALGLSESTVKFHLRSLFRKLAVDSRGALAEAALRRGIVT